MKAFIKSHAIPVNWTFSLLSVHHVTYPAKASARAVNFATQASSSFLRCIAGSGFPSWKTSRKKVSVFEECLLLTFNDKENTVMAENGVKREVSLLLKQKSKVLQSFFRAIVEDCFSLFAGCSILCILRSIKASKSSTTQFCQRIQ